MANSSQEPAANFEEWLEFCFDPNGQDNYVTEETILDLSGAILATYFYRLFSDPLKYLEHREQVHIAKGLWYIFGVNSNFWWKIRDTKVPEDLQINAVRQLPHYMRKDSMFFAICAKRSMLHLQTILTHLTARSTCSGTWIVLRAPP